MPLGPWSSCQNLAPKVSLGGAIGLCDHASGALVLVSKLGPESILGGCHWTLRPCLCGLGLCVKTWPRKYPWGVPLDSATMPLWPWSLCHNQAPRVSPRGAMGLGDQVWVATSW